MSTLVFNVFLFIGFLMTRNPMFYFSLAALVLGILSGLYLFLEWLRHGRRHTFPLLWGIGLFSLYWFQIPFILANAGFHFTVTDFNVFYTFSLPTTFGGLTLIYLGILSVLRPQNLGKIKRYLLLWFIACLLVFFYYFIVEKGMIATHTLIFVVNLLFFAPTRLLILFALWRWLRLQDWTKTKATVLGIWLMAGWAIIGTAGNVLAIQKLLTYPANFWFIALSEFKFLFVLQSTSMLLLVLGFILVYRSCFRNLNLSGGRRFN